MNASSRFTILYSFLIACLIFVLLAAFVFQGILSWSAGLIYIAYDSFIQCLVVWISSKSLDGNPVLPLAKMSNQPLPTVSAVIPARNEKSVLGECLEALNTQTYIPEEIIIVDDGSTDGTLEWLTERFQLHFKENYAKSLVQSNLRVIRKEQSGKADSLNFGWQKAESEVVVTIDADTVLEPDAMLEVCRAFAEDPNLAAAGGVLAPRCEKSGTGGIFQFYQTFEYFRSFLERYAWMSFGTLILVSGAFSAFRRTILQKLNGFDKKSMVEDYELIYRLYRDSVSRGLRPNVRVIGSARAVTDAPSNVKNFLRQRSRWFAGFLETLFQNKEMVANPRYGRFGLFMLPMKLVDTLKPIYGLLALAIFLGYLTAGFRPYLFIIYILTGKLLFDLILHCRAFILFHRWQAKEIGPLLWVRSMLAILTEPFLFQILRHVAAVLGVIAYLNGRIGWAHQREIPTKV